MSGNSFVNAALGAAGGFVIGGPAGALLGAGAGLLAGSLFSGPKIEGPRLSDLRIQTSTYGAAIPRTYGTIAFAGNIIWLEGGKLREVVKKNKSGGKGGSSTEPDKTYTYFATFHLALCEGPIQGIRRIWCSDKLIYDAGSDDLETIIASNEAARGWTLYRGTDDQMPEPRYEADVGVDNATANRGLAYLAFRDWNLTDYGNTLEGAQFKVEVIGSQTVTSPTLFDQRTMIGEPVYSDEATIQTVDNYQKSQITINEVDYIKGTLTYRTYNRSGKILRVETVSVQTPKLDNISLGSYKVFPLFGVKGQLFLYDQINKIVDGDIRFSNASITTFPDGTLHHKKFGDIAFVAGTDGSYYFINSSGIPALCASGGNYSAVEFAQDATTGRVYISYALDNDTYVGELSTNTGEVLWSVYVLTRQSGSFPTFLSFYVYAGRALIHANTAVRLLDVSSDSATPIGLLASPTASARVYPYAPGFAIGFAISSNTGMIYRLDDVPTFSSHPLPDVLAREVSLSSLISVSDIDVSRLSDVVKGYQISGGSIRSALEPLATAFQFDVIQSGYKIKFVPRGGASALNVPYEDLGATNSDTPDKVFSQSREMDTQLPAKTTVSYLDAEREYEVSEQSATRINTEAVNEEDVELAIVQSADEAAGVAEILQTRAWLERTSMSFTIPPTYLNLEPTDVITVDAKSAIHEVFIQEIDYTEDGRLEIKGVPNSSAIYVPNASGGQGGAPTGTIGVTGPSIFVPLDIPLVDEISQNSLGFIGAMTGYTNGWPGATLFRSGDSGQTWTDIQGYAGKGGIGTVFSTLSASDGYLIDQSEISVIMISGELESITLDQLLTGYNYAAYGADGRWEIVRFQNAELQVDGSYIVSDFLRGDKGTEWATGLHESGDWFILLDDPDNAFISMATESIGLDRLYRGITQRASIESGDNVEFTYEAVNLKPLSPVNAEAERDGAGDLTATFTRRSRLGSTWWGNGTQAPVGETTEAYEIDVMDGSSVVRTIESATPAFSYSAADQSTDFGSAQSSILFRIYQLSGQVGRGYVREVTL
ncbi:MAG: phage tail protein [Pseudomonas neustonica]